jgi:prepilin-type N-terminal cleavage/methylation domain-containing protein
MNMRRDEDGFTLMEVMVVVLVLAALVMIAVPVFRTSTAKAATVSCLANRTIVERAAGVYASQVGTSPVAVADLVSGRYIQSVPKCPSKGVYVFDSKRTGGDDALYCSIHYGG